MVLPGTEGLFVGLFLLLAHAPFQVLSNISLAGTHGTPGVYPTFLLVAPVSMLRLRLSSELGTVQYTEVPTFLVPEIFEFPE